jgi:hypothetical protein
MTEAKTFTNSLHPGIVVCHPVGEGKETHHRTYFGDFSLSSRRHRLKKPVACAVLALQAELPR